MRYGLPFAIGLALVLVAACGMKYLENQTEPETVTLTGDVTAPAERTVITDAHCPTPGEIDGLDAKAGATDMQGQHEDMTTGTPTDLRLATFAMG